MTIFAARENTHEVTSRFQWKIFTVSLVCHTAPHVVVCATRWTLLLSSGSEPEAKACVQYATNCSTKLLTTSRTFTCFKKSKLKSYFTLRSHNSTMHFIVKSIFVFATVLQVINAFVPLLRQTPLRTTGSISLRTTEFNAGGERVFKGNGYQKSLPITSLSTTASVASSETSQPLSDRTKKLTKIGMIAFIATVALGLISSLSVIKLLGYVGISEVRRQRWALSTGQFCARWALRLFPFCKVDVIVDKDADSYKNPEPAIWVSNHMSMLDVFLLLASDLKMRGSKKRPIKVVYVSVVCVCVCVVNNIVRDCQKTTA